MGSRWFNFLVVLLWMTTMGWLVVEKILPPWLIGDPPSYEKILHARKGEPPVGWRLYLGNRGLRRGQPIGWALSAAVPITDQHTENRVTEIRSRVHFEQLPLAELTPGWIGGFLRLTKYGRTKMQMDTSSTLTIDSLGRLTRFESALRLEGIRDVVRMEGVVEEGDLQLSVRAGELTHHERIAALSPDAVLGDSLSPQAKLPDLRQGQTWRVPSFSPFGTSAEELIAKVEGRETVEWDGAWHDARLVVYRSDAGIGLGIDKVPRCKLWVLKDGTVVKQQVTMFNSRLTFIRMAEAEAARLARLVSIDGEDGGRLPPALPEAGHEEELP
jgi:hypothetical protein